MTLTRILAVITLLSAATAGGDELVDRADLDGDGYVSLYELRAAYFADLELNRRIEQSFADYDKDGDGLISAAERAAKRQVPPAATPAPARAAPGAPPPALRPAVPTGVALIPDPSPERAPKPGPVVAAPAPRVARGYDPTPSRAASMLQEIDSDNSGTASIAELIASGDGEQWFSTRSFTSADQNGDGVLDPDELEVLLQSLERRAR